jgi:hypothetical protein
MIERNQAFGMAGHRAVGETKAVRITGCAVRPVYLLAVRPFDWLELLARSVASTGLKVLDQRQRSVMRGNPC